MPLLIRWQAPFIMCEAKSAIRKIIKAQESALDGEYLKNSDNEMFSRFFELPEFVSAKAVFCFYGMGKEPETRGIIERSLALGKTVAVPKVSEDGTMCAVVVHSISELVPGTFGIPEPSNCGKIITQEDIDIAVIPALAFDKEGFRLGRGGGYYDRWLAVYDGFSVGLARQVLLQDSVPRDAWDIPVKCIITEKMTARFRQEPHR